MGALIGSQVVALTAALVWLVLGETLVAALRPEIGRWLPFRALRSLFIPSAAVDVEVSGNRCRSRWLPP